MYNANLTAKQRIAKDAIQYGIGIRGNQRHRTSALEGYGCIYRPLVYNSHASPEYTAHPYLMARTKHTHSPARKCCNHLSAVATSLANQLAPNPESNRSHVELRPIRKPKIRGERCMSTRTDGYALTEITSHQP